MRLLSYNIDMSNILLAIAIVILLTFPARGDVLVSGLPNFQTVSEWSKYLKANFTYQAEENREDYWKTPEETIRDKGGDCEDLAILSQVELKKLGVESKLILLELKDKDGKKGGHVFCVYFTDKGATIFDCTHTVKSNAKDVVGVLNDKYPTWTRWTETKDHREFWRWNWR